MLNNQKLLIIGGDARYLEVIDKLTAEGAAIFLIGYGQLRFESPSIRQTDLDKLDMSMIDAIILPVGGTNIAGEIRANYADETIYLSEDLFEQTPEHCTIYTGTSNSFLDQVSASTNRRLVRLFTRDDMAIFNSIPTAEGALNLAMDELDVTIHGSNVMILGFGRVGITVARLFDAVGADVRVGVRSAADIARITEMGLKPIQLGNLEKNIGDVDICINTIPHRIIDSSTILAMEPSSLIIDLASKPGGTDFEFAKKHGIKAVHALGLPGKTAPKSAGRIIAQVLLELLGE
ncbi:dipicolinic acid synthetase subunit A [Virgibacillus sp. NKC19-3]|uniref:dipicolinic acid synthetase subunit A n=1 Tax=Virgibacillus saliphilus TaxID=2831674 RepID=UPI001C9B2E61|nr:dipicolinic acid synthetase subunit A [Virgibacillus sp. NKC19-3]MBY7143165.1 dipicolinic acid synthetase subunit A [Virgibacillus sp. NKC19-3]